MPRFTPPYLFATALLALILAGCASSPLPPPTPPRTTSQPSTTITTPQGGVSRAQLDAAGNACEKRVADAVKTRYPQPGSVMMMPDRERIAQQTTNQTSISGEGTFEPDASEEAMSFRYTCLYNMRTQRVDDVQMKYGPH
ncbi:short-chain fatty acid transporter [Cupriavidus pauculus]|uniref:Short-chain fatty acid transporter n=1 Tax=Cupriavidus pauculus TaxID=82633 RepID=A0A2N5C4R8_9BURK|nr:short-chain fatty acid transporter [Cupriavidus pauculus]PLP97180.1 short-chain fatty acid transporter [Cupriavidus pauculus]